jgi:hypothetical protein
MTFNHINRRLHLYLALILLPWAMMYGISAIPFAHNSFFNTLYKDGVPQWTTRFEQPYDRPVPEKWSADVLRPFAKEVIDDLDIKINSAYGAYRPNKRQIMINVYDFWNNTRMVYDIEKQHITVQDKRFRWDQFFTSLHARGGFRQDTFLDTLWCVVIDIVSLGFILWSCSGIYMWWLLKGTRRWGTIALGGGFLSFVIFLVTL